MISKTETQLNVIQEYMDAVSDYHEATLLVAEMRTRLVEAIQANKQAGVSNPDPLSAIVGFSAKQTEPLVEAITRKAPVVSRNGSGSGSRKRNSPGHTKKVVYEALPGSAEAISRRTGLPQRKVWAAMADLMNAGLAQRHGSRGNTTYTVKGTKVNWTEKQFAPKYTAKSSNN